MQVTQPVELDERAGAEEHTKYGIAAGTAPWKKSIAVWASAHIRMRDQFEIATVPGTLTVCADMGSDASSRGEPVWLLVLTDSGWRPWRRPRPAAVCAVVQCGPGGP